MQEVDGEGILRYQEHQSHKGAIKGALSTSEQTGALGTLSDFDDLFILFQLQRVSKSGRALGKSAQWIESAMRVLATAASQYARLHRSFV